MNDTPKTDSPRRVRRKRTKGARTPDGCICVDRSTGFGNPFPVKRATSIGMGVYKHVWVVGSWTSPAIWFKDTREDAVRLSLDAYREWINHPQQQTLREKAIKSLRGRDLACWCPDGSPCHADVLLEIANA